MAKWSLVTKIFAGAWAILGLILVFKVALAVTGNYAVNCDSEARFWAILIVPSAAFLAVRANHSPDQPR